MKIGIFDSGLGGRLILESVRNQLPQYDFAYYGDTAHVPYGDRPEEEIYTLTKRGVRHLMEQENCVLVILACNTASVETLRRLQDEFLPETYPGRRILGVVIPTLEVALESDVRRVLLLATSRTVSSGKYHLELGKRNELQMKIESISMPTLVPHIEAGEVATALSTVMDLIMSRAAQGVSYDGVILGCTHYSVLHTELQNTLGGEVKVFSQTEIIPQKLRMYLDAHRELEQQLSRTNTVTEHLTGS
jgi:glutamate racemase